MKEIVLLEDWPPFSKSRVLKAANVHVKGGAAGLVKAGVARWADEPEEEKTDPAEIATVATGDAKDPPENKKKSKRKK